MRKNLISLRNKYNGLVDGFHKQMGLRAIRDAIALGDRNQGQLENLVARAEFHLPYAVAVDERENSFKKESNYED